ncbi:MAG: protein kinase [Pirellulales bacterium]
MQLKRLGPYEIGEPLGKGGMGSVFVATDTQTGQRVAVKALTPHLAMADGFRERFEAEIESLKTLRHDGIVRLYGYGEQDGVLFYSMELVEGTSLEDELKAGRRFNWREVTGIGIQLALALKHAHDHGVVHRDIKPANILLFGEEHVKLADFGIARLFGSSQLTTAGGVLGTADYMSPEQADGRPVTTRCDQYSLGGVMYALLAGRPPFRAKNLPQMLQLQRFAEPEPVRRYAPDTPEQLERVILQLLAKDPADRFPNTQVLARHLQAMFMALSRPTADDFSLADELLTDDATDEAHDQSLLSARTRDDPDEGPPGARRRPTSGGTMGRPIQHATGVAGETRPPAAEDQSSHDAATLAADEARGEFGWQASRAQSTTGTRLLGDPGTQLDREAGAPLPSRPAHFTTIEEEESQRQAQRRRSWPVMLAQLAALAAVIGGLIGLTIYLTRPATADELYRAIKSKADTVGDSLTPVEAHLKEFFARFPEDPRTAELRQVERRIELDRAQRRLQLAARRGGFADPSLLPVEQLYLRATNTAQDAPELGAALLESLIALYSVPPVETGDGDTASVEERDRMSLCVELAQLELATLRQELVQQTKRQLSALQERLDAADRLRETDGARAIQMYRAIVDLHHNHAWANEIVAAARRRIADHEKQQ